MTFLLRRSVWRTSITLSMKGPSRHDAFINRSMIDEQSSNEYGINGNWPYAFFFGDKWCCEPSRHGWKLCQSEGCHARWTLEEMFRSCSEEINDRCCQKPLWNSSIGQDSARLQTKDENTEAKIFSIPLDFISYRRWKHASEHICESGRIKRKIAGFWINQRQIEVF